ncbi:MAG: archaeal flagellin FlaB [Methanoculleus sp.]|nr:archaeal flagellin FlaB [Methanoculleus sp.]MDK2990191.1 archaeal flagellin FlaB [Methanoculleus sp.]
MGGSEAYTHLELAVIFAAFVAVTTLFSLVSLGASAMDSGPSPDSGADPVLAAGEPRLAPAGEVTGSSSVPGLPGTYIDTLVFRVVHTGEGGCVDLSRATVTVMAGTYLEILTLSGSSLPGPGTWSAAVPGGGTLLFSGEECTIRLCLDRPVPADEALTVLVRPEGNAPCSITGPVRIPATDANALSSPDKD